MTIDSAEPTPEEFPDFTEFFIEGAKSDQEPETIYALCGVSKKVFKQAIGALYKQKHIIIDKTTIRLD